MAKSTGTSIDLSKLVEEHFGLGGFDEAAQKALLRLLGVNTGFSAVLTFKNKSEPILPSELVKTLLDANIAKTVDEAQEVIGKMRVMGLGAYDFILKDIEGKTHYQVIPIYLNNSLPRSSDPYNSL